MKRQIHKTILSWIAVAAMLLSSLGSAAVLAEGDPAAVQDAIAAIGQVSFRQSCLDAITAAETAYNNLDETQKTRCPTPPCSLRPGPNTTGWPR